MKRRRGLRPDEHELWARVVEQATPMHPHPPAPDPTVPPPTRPNPKQTTALPPLVRPPLTGGTVRVDLRPSMPEALADARIDMDRKTFGRLRRGKLIPEARIDLHGMTQAEAHAELRDFVLLSHGLGRRLVLVITGKGDRGAPGGILRRQVPMWLSLPPLKSLVLQIVESHIRHGGAGAYYLYLRRTR